MAEAIGGGAILSGLFSKLSLLAGTYGQGYMAIRRQRDYQKLIELQNTKLHKLIDFAVRNTTYYRETFENAGISPDRIVRSEDLVNVPFLTKQDLRNHMWDILPANLPECRVNLTSGSTGSPVCILSDWQSRCLNSAAVIRSRKAWGMGLVGRAIVTPARTAGEPYNRPPHWTFLQGMHKTYYINPYIDSAENRDHAANVLRKLRQPALIGLTTAVKHLAYRVKDGGFPRFRPHIVVTMGEVLSTEVRHLLATTFETDIVDVYACTETGDIAWQCRQGLGYHMNIDNVVVELLKGGQPASDGEVGEVVVTNLNRYAMPIIRYKTGDLARVVHKECGCGCRLPLIAEILGRTGQDIVLPDGSILPWNQLRNSINHPYIRAFQIVQDADGALTVKYVKEPGTDQTAVEDLITKRYKKVVGSSLDVTATQVQHIEPAASGKHEIVISHFILKPGHRRQMVASADTQTEKVELGHPPSQ